MMQQLLSELIEKVYTDDSFNEAISEPVKSLFDLRSILALFKETLEMRSIEIDRKFIQLSKECFLNGVAYSQYVEFFELFSKRLVNEASAYPDSSELVTRIYDIYQIVKGSNAKGYLQELLERDLFNLNNQIDESVASEAIKYHLYWMQKLIMDIQFGNEEMTFELDENACAFAHWMHEGDMSKYFSDAEEKEIITMHNNIHALGRSICDAIRMQKYHKVLIDYLMVTRLSLYLVSRLSFKVTERNLIEKSQRDALTGLENRQSLDENLESIHKEHKLRGHNYCIALIDADHFKRINDTYGHPDGDIVLQELANIFTMALRSSDRVYRYGGEEFLVLLSQTNRTNAKQVMENLRKRVESHPFKLSTTTVYMTVSIGMAEFTPEETISAQEVIKKSDINLYKAKENGRNQVICAQE